MWESFQTCRVDACTEACTLYEEAHDMSDHYCCWHGGMPFFSDCHAEIAMIYSIRQWRYRLFGLRFRFSVKNNLENLGHILYFKFVWSFQRCWSTWRMPMGDREAEAHSMIRSGQVVFSQSCTATHDAHAHHAYRTYWLGTRVPIPPGRYVCQYNETLSPLEGKECYCPTASLLRDCLLHRSRRWRSGNCFLFGWLWHVDHEIRRFARRAMRLIWNAMTKSVATKSFLMRWKKKRFLGQIFWPEGGRTCLSKPLFEFASRESRWGAMSGPCLAEKFLRSTLLEPLHHDMCSGFLAPRACSS